MIFSCIITGCECASENSSENSCKLKTFSCGNCKQSFAHSQSMIMHEKESFKGKAICSDYSKSSYKQKLSHVAIVKQILQTREQ